MRAIACSNEVQPGRPALVCLLLAISVVVRVRFDVLISENSCDRRVNIGFARWQLMNVDGHREEQRNASRDCASRNRGQNEYKESDAYMESASQPLPPSRNESGCEGVGQVRDPRENGEDSPDSSQTATLCLSRS
jgi:hypothetical protein